ncbi:MAG: hypothetical protein JWR75_1458 [Devosia sp.]|nr:hypothetical protein [Devosia sp.]
MSQHDTKSRVIIYGTHSDSWMKAIAVDSKVWELTRGTGTVVLQGELSASPVDDAGCRTVVVPLLERHIRSCPKTFSSLAPELTALAILSDKSKFAAYVQSTGLAEFCPTAYSIADLQFPCVLKRVDLNAGAGIEVVNSQVHLHKLLTQSIWRDRPYILQELIPGVRDYVTHAVCRDGKILWQCSYVYELSGPIQRSGTRLSISKVEASLETLLVFARFLEPLSFSGPVSIDYRFTADGHLKVFEINPRLGGSLMRRSHVSDLAAAISCIVENARLPLPAIG